MDTEKTIQMNSKIVRNHEIISSNMDEEVVMMSIQDGKYFGINPVGARIWKLLEQPRGVSDMCGILQEEYDVIPSECQQDVLEFLKELLEKNLVKISG